MPQPTMPSDLSMLALLDALPLAIAVTAGEEHRVQYLNAAFRQLPGMESPDVLGRPFLELLAPPQQAFARSLSAAYHGGEPVRRRAVEYCGLVRGTTYWDYTIWPLRSDERTTGLLVILEETTEEVEARTASRRRDELLRSLLEAEPVAVAVLRGPEHVCEYVNPAYEALFGTPSREWLDRPFWELCRACLSPEALEVAGRVYRHGVSERLDDLRLPPLDGAEAVRHASLHMVPTRDQDGAVDGVILAVWETTELVATRQVAAERAARLETILAGMTEGVALVGRDYRVQYVNAAARQFVDRAFTRKRTSEALFREYNLRDALGAPLALQRTPLPRVFQGETVDGYEVMVRPPGTENDIVLSFNAAPVQAADGTVSGALLVFRDVTHTREMDRLKDELIGLVSHELRTPTTTIRAGLNLLRRYGPDLDPALENILQDMEGEAERLHNLIENMLGLARLSAGVRASTGPVRAGKVIRSAIEGAPVRDGSHRIRMDLPEDLPLVESEPGYLTQVVRNLVENARKYAPVGTEITLTAARRGGEVVFSVLDRGPGVPTEEREHVFAPFRRVARTATQAGGAGLGLTLCRRLIEAQGGRIWVDDRPEGGAAFRFTLPVVRETAMGTPEAPL